MKFKKGSKEAKAYMAKLRAAKGKKTTAKKTAAKKVGAVKTPVQYKGYTINFIRGNYRAEAYGNPQFSETSLVKVKKKIDNYLNPKKVGSTLKLNKKETRLGIAPKTKAIKGDRKKIAAKKFSSYHKDTKSHNVNIRVVSGYKQTPEIIVGKVGSLTVLKSLAPEIKLRITRGKKVSTTKIASAKDSVNILRKFITPSKIQTQEFAAAIFLNNNNNVLAVYQLGMGGFTATIFEKRLLFAAALKLGATAIILCHNHPSGTLTPSQADKMFTKQISEVAKIHDLNLLDHIILTKDSYYSFAENGII